MLTRIIKLFDVGIIKLSGILLYDDTGSTINVALMKASQSSTATITLDNVTTQFLPENVLQGKVAMTAPATSTEESWWQLDLLQPKQIYKITIIGTNIHNVKCFADADPGTKEIYNKRSQGLQSLANTTTFTVSLTPYYTLSSVIDSGCTRGTNKSYKYITCKDSPLEACSRFFTPIPDNVWPDLRLPGINSSFKWNVISNTPCNFSQQVAQDLCLKDTASSIKCKENCKSQGGKDCDLLPVVSDWSQWSVCQEQVSKRTRNCTGNCVGVRVSEDWKCINYSFGEWGPFGPCENSVAVRFRECIPGFNGTRIDCPGNELKESKQCGSGNGALEGGLVGAGYLVILIPMIIIFVVIIIFLIIFFRK
jgi:hypothetical protein